MYGYIRPVKGELKVSEYERYRGVYCGLCHRLKRRYGPLARFLVSYDFVFWVMLLSGGCTETKTIKCPYHPLKKGLSCPSAEEMLNIAADQTVILAWWKFADGIADNGFLKAVPYRFLRLLFLRDYRRAGKRQPQFAKTVETQLTVLASLEAEQCTSPDKTADCFASILRASCEGEPNTERRRIFGELMYHMGRIIYLLDAVDDLTEDLKTGKYNPLVCRYNVKDKLSGAHEEEVRRLLQLSHNAISSAFALLEETVYTPILSNIIYLGLPAVTASVFSGRGQSGTDKKTERSIL